MRCILLRLSVGAAAGRVGQAAQRLGSHHTASPDARQRAGRLEIRRCQQREGSASHRLTRHARPWGQPWQDRRAARPACREIARAVVADRDELTWR